MSTSVIGHLMKLDYTEELQSWDVDIQTLFQEGNVCQVFEDDGEQLVQ